LAAAGSVVCGNVFAMHYVRAAASVSETASAHRSGASDAADLIDAPTANSMPILNVVCGEYPDIRVQKTSRYPG
jgi:hypothetical protein